MWACLSGKYGLFPGDRKISVTLTKQEEGIMKQIKKRLFCLLLAGVMAFSLAACGKDTPADSNSNSIKLEDFEIVNKGACIMKDFEG